MGKRARERVEQEYTVENMLKQVEMVYIGQKG